MAHHPSWGYNTGGKDEGSPARTRAGGGSIENWLYSESQSTLLSAQAHTNTHRNTHMITNCGSQEHDPGQTVVFTLIISRKHPSHSCPEILKTNVSHLVL